MRHENTNISGATLLELLVALCISGIILGGLLGFLSLSAKTHFKWQSLQKKRASFEEFRLWTQSGEQGCLSDSRLTLCRVHQDGIIRDSLGTPHVVHQAVERLRPRPTSNAISFVSLEPSLYFTRDPKRSITQSGSVYRLSLCKVALEGSALLPYLFESWLIRTPDGYLLTRGNIRKKKGSTSSCPGQAYDGRFLLEPNLMFAKPCLALKELSPTAWPHYLLLGAEEVQAISEAYTLYVSTEGAIRRLSHSTSENQPLAEGVESIQLVSEEHGSYRVYLQFAGRRLRKYSFPLRIPAPQAPAIYSLIN